MPCRARPRRAPRPRPRVASAPGSRQQKIQAVSPFTSCGTPIAAASRTAGWPTAADSSSAGPIRLPAMFIVSSERPCRNQKPSASTEAQSPCTQTPGIRDQYVSRYLSGSRQKPRVIPGNGPAADELADLAGADQRVAGVVDDVHRHPERRAAERARLDRADGSGREEAGADLGAARAVDDRHARTADVLGQPPVRLGVPRLARRDEGAQRREVGGRVAVGQQRARQRRREPERGDALLLDDAPEAVRRGPVGSALREDDRAAERADADDGPRAHDPAHVGGEVHDVAFVHVGLVGGLAGDRDEEPALHVQHALRLAGRPGGVGQQVRRLGVDLERRQAARPAVELERREHDVRLRARRADRLLEDLEHRHAAPAPRRLAPC